MYRGTFSFHFLKWGKRISFWKAKYKFIFHAGQAGVNRFSTKVQEQDWACPGKKKKNMSSLFHFSLVTDLVTDLVTQMVAYLEWPNHELKDHLHFCFEIVREENKHDVVNAKERDQQQSGLGQPPVGKANMSHEGRGNRVRGWGICSWALCNPKNLLFLLVPQTADGWWFQTWWHHKMWHFYSQ